MTYNNISKKKNKDYFENIGNEYADRIMNIQPELYRNSSRIINHILSDNNTGEQTVLDIGNGGVINYDYTYLKKLICADLYISETAVKKYSKDKNVEFVIDDIFQLNFKENTFDTVIVQAVIHHLAGSRMKYTYDNVSKALNECMRVLKPGGNLLILESTVALWFEWIERTFYPFMYCFFRICRFGPVFQFSADSLERLIKNKGFIVKERQNIDLDKYIWIMNKKVLSCLTPCKFTEFLIKKQQEHR